jgi:hypothetical protein
MGRHNWKVDAQYENRCRYMVTRYHGFRGDFRDAMVQLDSALVASGWMRDAGGIDTDSLVPVILKTNRYVLVVGVLREDYFVN